MNYLKKFIMCLNNKIDTNEESAYLVGGYVRDKLIKSSMDPKDADFIYDGDIKGLIEYLNSSGYQFMPIKESRETYRCMLNGNCIDITKMQGKTIVEDLSKRDFTANAICLEVGKNKIIDPFEGRKAIKNRIIKAVSSDSIKKDPIRILRGIRLYISYGMHFNLDTENMIKKYAFKLKEVAGEKIFSELMLILENDKDGRAFDILNTFSVLNFLIPYVEELKTMGKCKYHQEDVFTHANLTYMAFKDILSHRITIKNLDNNIFNYKIGDFTLREYTSIACFLHDIGKYEAYKKEGNKVSFAGHEKNGRIICEKLCNRLRFPKKASKFIEDIVSAHMYPLIFFKNGFENSKHMIYDFFYKYGELSRYIIVVAFCDNYATRMLSYENSEKRRFKVFIEKMLEEYDIYSNLKNNQLVDGNYIVDVLGFRGVIIGNIMYNIDKLRYLKKLKTRQDVIDYINKLKKLR